MISLRRKNILLVNLMNFRHHQVKRSNQRITTTYVKPNIINLRDIALTVNQIFNLGPKFVPTEKRITFMEIITATESVALNLK